MTVREIAITQAFPIVDPETGVSTSLTPEDLIVYCARVSNPGNQLNTATGAKLLRHCLLSQPPHISIFGMVDLTVEVVTSRSISAQILRHWSFSFQEFSQRYTAVTASEPIELRKQGTTNRQGGSEPLARPDLDERVRQHVSESFALYNTLLEAGAARETARDVLPLSTQTRLYVKGSVRSWLTYLNVRLDAHTQKEHRAIALEVAAIMQRRFPCLSEATGQYGNLLGNFMNTRP